MASFKGNTNIIIQPNDNGVPYGFQFSVCSSASGNDGYLPFGTTISGAVVTATTDEGVDATSGLIVSSSELNELVTVNMKYPTVLGEGKYNMKFVLTLNSGTIIEADFNRIEAKNT